MASHTNPVRPPAPGAAVAWLAALTTLAVLLPRPASADEPRPLRKGRSRIVQLESAPPQAAIYLDDKRYGVVGYTPWKGKLVEGAYKLILVKEGFQEHTSDIVVDRKNTRFTRGLERDLRAFIGISTVSDPNVQGAAVTIDGEARGVAPVEVQVQAGRHQIALRKEGFEPFEQWVELAPGQKLALAPALRKQAVAPGSLLVDANVSGAAVRVDGKAHPDPTPTVVEGLAPGPHVVEVSVAGAPAWKGTVVVVSGQRAKVSAEIAVPKAPEKPATGALLLDADQPGAHARVDGREVPEALPTVVEGLAPGPHVVEIRKDGFAPWKATADVVAGARAKVSATLQPLAKTPPPALGTVRVRARDEKGWHNGAAVLLDGKKFGVTPLDIRRVAAGKHRLHVEGTAGVAEGEVTAVADALVEVVVTLAPAGQPAKFETKAATPLPGAQPQKAAPAAGAPSQPSQAGQAAQPTPPTQPGPSTQPSQATPTPQPAQSAPSGQPGASTQPGDGAGPPAAAPGNDGGALAPPTDGAGPLDDPISGMLSSYGARVLPYGALTLDLGLGYPWYIDVRGTAGLLKDRYLGLDAAIHLRSNFLRTEGLLRMRFRLADGGPFAAAVFGTVGGGTGTGGRNSFTFQGGISGSVFFGERAALSVHAMIDTWSDRLCAERGSEEFDAKAGSDVCYEDLSLDPTKKKRVQELVGTTNLQERDGGLRLTFGASLEIALSQRTNLYATVETSPAQAERASFTPLFHEAMVFTEDPVMSGRLGLTFKF